MQLERQNDCQIHFAVGDGFVEMTVEVIDFGFVGLLQFLHRGSGAIHGFGGSAGFWQIYEGAIFNFFQILTTIEF